MGMFKQTKDTMYLIITVVVLIFVTLFFYYTFGSFKVGSNIDVRAKEMDLMVLRTLRCLENNEDLDECVKQDKYMILVESNGKKIGFVNEDEYKKLKDDYHIVDIVYNFGGDKPYKITLRYTFLKKLLGVV